MEPGWPARFWNVIVYDEDDHPAAVACFFARQADAFMIAAGSLKSPSAMPVAHGRGFSVPDVVLRCLPRPAGTDCAFAPTWMPRRSSRNSIGPKKKFDGTARPPGSV